MQSFLGDFQNKLRSLEDRCKHICKYENKRWQSEMRQVLPQQVITTLRQHRTVVKRKKTKPNNTRLAENVNTWSLLISVRYISFFIFCRLDHAIIGRNGSRGQRNGEAQRKQCRASFFTLRTALQFYNLHWPSLLWIPLVTSPLMRKPSFYLVLYDNLFINRLVFRCSSEERQPLSSIRPSRLRQSTRCLWSTFLMLQKVS